MYVDEAGIDNRQEYPYGYCEIGQRFYALKSGKRTERVSWIAALKEKCLRSEEHTSELQPGDIIVIDNASFHHSQAIEEIVAQVGCQLWYLPPYSPDLNEIEHWWFVLKNWMRQRWNEFDTFRQCVDAAFKYCPNVHA